VATLARSLVLLRQEIDARWPHRDRRTDGWYRAPGTGVVQPSDHWPDSRGIVHAIDVDKDGIRPDWVIANMYHGASVLHYVIWNRRIWTNTGGWHSTVYTGSNPHTDHMHFSIYHTTTAEGYSRGWGIAPGTSGFGGAPATVGFGSAEEWDYRPAVDGLAARLSTLADAANAHSRLLGGLMR
jgi:hypothetical protein